MSLLFSVSLDETGVCVCVCVVENEHQRERGGVEDLMHLGVSRWRCVCVCVCVRMCGEREREKSNYQNNFNRRPSK